MKSKSDRAVCVLDVWSFFVKSICYRMFEWVTNTSFFMKLIHDNETINIDSY